MKRLIGLNFANTFKESPAGFLTFSWLYSSPYHLWIDPSEDVWRPSVADDLLDYFLKGRDCEFRIGLTPGEYAVTLTFFDPVAGHGPFDIIVAETDGTAPKGSGTVLAAAERVLVPKNETVRKVLHFNLMHGAAAPRFIAADGADFIVNCLEISGGETAELVMMFPEAPDTDLPDAADLGAHDPEKALLRVSAWLARKRDPTGFLGDTERSVKLWYTCSYPIRTFLAAYGITGDRRYLDISAEILDLLVSEQMPNGAFTQVCRNQRTADLSEAEIERVKSRYWMNLADVGSMVAALAAACHYVGGDRQRHYLDAVRNYCDGWARQFQKPDGGFTNGWLKDHYAAWRYGVATASSAMVFTIFAEVSGESGYREVAEAAADFLIRDWNEDGKPTGWPHDGMYPGGAHPQSVRQFGDLFYIHEAISYVFHHSDDRALRSRIFDAMRKHLFGREGLLALLGGKTWWPIQDVWNNSKSAGMPIVLKDFLEGGEEFGATAEEMARVRRAYAVTSAFLCSAEHSRQIGVMSEDPPLPWGPHTMLSWSGCSVAASGFAGIALAEMARPGIVYLRK